MLTPVPDLIYGALAEIRVARGGDVVRAEDQGLCLGFLNEILERLAVTPNAIYAQGPGGGLLTPGVSVFTIGPTGDQVAPRRPVDILQASVFVGQTRVPLTRKSLDWSSALTLPYLTSTVPEFYFYNPTWPDGGVGLVPTPTQANILSFVLKVEIVAVAISDTIDLPPGYSELLRLWTAKKAAPSFAREFSSASQQALTECLADVFGTNIGRVNDLDTRDGGVPRGQGAGRGGTYDYRTGLVT